MRSLRTIRCSASPAPHEPVLKFGQSQVKGPEFFYEEEFGQARTFSAVLGTIWQGKDDLLFDVRVRHAVTNSHSIDESRAGMTFGFPLRLTRLAGP